MAQRVTIIKTCDVAGEDTVAVATYEFTYGGEQFSIDLGAENSKLFEAEMNYWSSAAQKEGGSKRKTKRPTKRRHANPETVDEASGPVLDSAVVRAWARENGWPDLSGRGRVSQAIKDQYIQAQALVTV